MADKARRPGIALTRLHELNTSEEAGVRFLHFGSEWVQGAMRIARPYALELNYTREMMACLLFREPPWPKRVLQVGLGAGSISKFWWRHFPHTQQTIIEINQAVVHMAAHAFKLPTDAARIEIVIDDGVAWMKAAPEKFDCIMVDGYDQHARFGALGTEDFYRDCRERLARDGVLVLNLFGRSRGYQKQLDALVCAFGGKLERILALPPVEGEGGGNAIVLAAMRAWEVDAEAMRRASAWVQTQTGLNLKATVARIEKGR